MKCIVCKTEEGAVNWFYKTDASTKVLNCVCSDCFDNETSKILDDCFAVAFLSNGLKEDKVNHPNHYTWLPGVECQNVVQHFNFNLGNVIKYVWRVGNPNATKHNTKEGLVEDLQKAIKYLEFEIERLKEGK